MITLHTCTPLACWVSGKTCGRSASGLEPDSGVADLGRADKFVERDLMGLGER
jgi:hypothetical protein